jgi:hypothetical protein
VGLEVLVVTSMKMAIFWDLGAVRFSEMVVFFCETTCCIIPEDSRLDIMCVMD